MRTLMALIAVTMVAAPTSAQDGAKQNSVDTVGAPWSEGAKTDAEPGYWTNLFENTMRFTVMHPAGKQVVDVFYNRDKTVGTNVGLSGTWTTEGEPGKEMFCYDLGAFKAEPVTLGECFPLRLMNNPRIGAKWGGKMKPGVNYLAEVVGGRPNAPAVSAATIQAN
jgi:hypothetical protein